MEGIFISTLESITKTIEEALSASSTHGYLIIDGLIFSDEIIKNLELISSSEIRVLKAKLKAISNEHNLSASQIALILVSAAMDPIAIIADAKRHSFQFYSVISGQGYRSVLAFNTSPKYENGIKANVLVTLFREDRFLNRIKRIKEGKIDGLTIVYEKRDGLGINCHSHLFCK